MIAKKYEESNQLIAQTRGLPSIIQDQLIVSDSERETAKQCVLYLKQQLSLSKNEVWIPYGGILGEALKAEKGTDVRNTKRIFSLLNTIPLVKSDNRPKLSLKGEISVVSILDDLSEVLAITQNLNGIPVYKMKFFQEIFQHVFKSKTEPDKSKDHTKEESRIAVTSKQLAEAYTKKYGRASNAENIRKNYLNEFLNNGLIEDETSIIDHRQKIYYPIVGLDDDDLLYNSDNQDEKIRKCGIGGQFRNFLQHSEVILPKNCRQIDENWLLFEILSFLEYGIGLKDMEIYNNLGDKQTIKQFISDYEQTLSLIPYFKKVYSCNYSHEKMGTIKYFGVVKQKDAQNYGNDSQSRNSVFSETDTTMTREQIIEAIEKAVSESNDLERYVCPICNAEKLKQQKDLHKMSCNGRMF
jgi:hypothetical protein